MGVVKFAEAWPHRSERRIERASSPFQRPRSGAERAPPAAAKVAAPAALLYPLRVMGCLRVAATGALAVLALAGCASRKPSQDLAGEPSALAAKGPGAAIPLDVREFDVVAGEGGYRGVFLKLSRLPTGVTSHSETAPPRIILDIAGPTGSETAAESYPGGDDLVTQVQLVRQIGVLQVVLELAGDDVPQFEVFPMADWVMVRIREPSNRRPWAHRAS